MAPLIRQKISLDKRLPSTGPDSLRTVPGVVVRDATADDLAHIAQIGQECHVDHRSPDQLRAELENPAYRGLVACMAGGRIAGYCMYQLIGDEGEIHGIATAPAHRRCGIAGTLMAQLLVDAREYGLRRLLLEVRGGNDAAIALYKSLGFGRDTVRKGYYADGEDAVLMSLGLPVACNDGLL